MDIISAYREVGTYRGAAELCGTTDKTVKRAVERAAAGGGRLEREPRPRNYDQVTDVVWKRVEKSLGRISAKRLLPVARAAGYEGSPRNFRRLVAQQKALWRSKNRRGRRPAVWSPGEYLVMDWAEAAPGLHLFCAVLAFSRWRFAAFATDQRQSTTLAMLAEALHALGGVPAKVLADRMGCLEGGVVANLVVPTAEYVRFATHYGFRPDWCNAADPESEGIVENLCGYSQSDLWVPLETEAAVAGRVVTVREANEAAKAWCREVNAAMHSEICAVPDERLALERELLAPLPSLRLEIGTASVTRKVDRGLADNTVGKVIDTVLRADLVILDEVGFAPLDDTGTQLLFRLVAAAYERRSLAVASHWSFEQWGRFLPEHTTAASILDRLLHHATVVITDGDSYRMKHRTTGGERP